MKISFLLAGFINALLAATVFANTPSVEPAQKAEPIKRAEFLRLQDTIFSKADKNYDGQITHDEIVRLTHALKTPKYISDFKALDKNKNGFLSYDEIEARHEEFTETAITRLSNMRASLLRKYDLDKNGTITSRELDTYIESQTQKRRNKTAQNAANDLRGKDSDGSGSLSLDEYIASKTVTARTLVRRPPGKNLALTRDPNGDKIITRSENETFANHLFEALDKNKDDKLSAAEQENWVFKQSKNLSTRTLYLTDNNVFSEWSK